MLFLCIFFWLFIVQYICGYVFIVRIIFSEIPLFHVLNARITFGNIFGVDSPAPGVSYIREEPEGTMTCVIEEPCFEPPTSYSVLGKMDVSSVE